MAAISVVEAIVEGFSVIRQRPLAVLTWGAARVALGAASMAVMVPMFTYLAGHFAELEQAGSEMRPDLSAIQQFQGFSNLMWLVGLVLGAVLYCAVTRSVLFPEARKYAYLRLGMAELFIIAWTFGIGVAVAFAIVPAVILIAVLVGLAALAHAAAVGVLVAIAGAMVLAVGVIYVLLRLAFVGPMTVSDGQFHLVDAWERGRGHVVDLFVVALGVFVILIAIELVIGGLMLAFGADILGQATGGLDHLEDFFHKPPETIIATLMRAFAPMLAVTAVLAIPVTGCIEAILFAPFARAYRDVTALQASAPG